MISSAADSELETIARARAGLKAFGEDGALLVEDVTPPAWNAFRAVKAVVPRRMNEWGRGASLEAATVGVLMERVERLSAQHAIQHVRIEKMVAGDRAATFIRLCELGLTNFQRFDELRHDDSVRANDYIAVRDLKDGTVAFAPASRVLLRYTGGIPDSSCSTGLAAHTDQGEATQRAILEAIERHFHHTTKFNRIVFQPVDLASALTSTLVPLVWEMERKGFFLYAWHSACAAPLHAVWIQIGKLTDRPGSYPFGARYHFACHWDVERAIERAVTEALVSRFATNAVRVVKRRFGDDVGELPGNLVGDGRPKVDLASCTTVVEGRQAALAGLAEALGGHVYVADLSNPDCGLPVMRALVTGIQPNFDLMGMAPDHPRARITQHLSIYGTIRARVANGEFSDQQLVEVRGTPSDGAALKKFESPRLLWDQPNRWVDPRQAPEAGELAGLLRARRTIRDVQGVLDAAQLLAILRLAVGHHSFTYTGNTGFVTRRNYPSGGSRHPLEFYIEVRNITNLNPGIYHFGAEDNSLTFLQEFLASDGLLAKSYSAAVVIWMVYMPRRSEWKYHRKAGALALVEAGHAGQNLCLLATQKGLNAVPLGVMGDRCEFTSLLKTNERPIYAIALGAPKATTSAPASNS